MGLPCEKLLFGSKQLVCMSGQQVALRLSLPRIATYKIPLRVHQTKLVGMPAFFDTAQKEFFRSDSNDVAHITRQKQPSIFICLELVRVFRENVRGIDFRIDRDAHELDRLAFEFTLKQLHLIALACARTWASRKEETRDIGFTSQVLGLNRFAASLG